MSLKERYYKAIEAEIMRMLNELVYDPLLVIVKMRLRELKRGAAEVRNSMSALRQAVAEGKIWYDDGQFKGTFNASTSAAIIKLGGVFNVKSKTYSLPAAKVPYDIKFAQAEAQSKYEQMRSGILSALANIDVNYIDTISKASEEYRATIGAMEHDLQKTVGAVPHVAIEAKLTEEQKNIIARDWGKNLDLYIKGWTEENIIKLREKVQPIVLAGGRAEGLVKTLEDNYGVATRKAKFLARQETALLMSKFQETRYKDMGITKYRWSTAHDERVRKDHKELNGKIFTFDLPPVTDRRTGARNNPGQDFNCRCVAIPVF